MKFFHQMILVAASVFSPLALAANDDLPVVSHVDLEKYMGHWYEIAALPNWFERDCFASQADYTLRDDGKVAVVNSCRKGSLTGELDSVTGTARVVDPETNAKLAVQFFWPFEGDYWIIALADDYSYAVVGAPSRDSLWILSRTATLDAEIVTKLLDDAEALGFAKDEVKMTPQSR